MTECHSPMMQDVLPDYLSLSLSDVERTAVDVHLSTCSACRADLVILREMRALRSRVATVDVARIVAALPRPVVVSTPPSEPSLVLLPSAARPSPIGERGTTTSVPTRRWSRSVWQIAATIGVMVVGGTSVYMARNSTVSVTESARSDAGRLGAVAESAMVEPSQVLALTPDAESLDFGARRSASAAASAVSVSYGDLGDYTDDELQRVLDRLNRWDGASSTDPLPSFPIVSGGGGGI